MLARLGHDGSEILFPEQPDPERRRAFHPQEMIDVAESVGVAITPIEGAPTLLPRSVSGPAYPVDLDNIERFQRYLEGQAGVLTGLNLRDRPHAVVWDGEYLWDPADGKRHGIHVFRTEIFWRAARRGSPLHLKLEGE